MTGCICIQHLGLNTIIDFVIFFAVVMDKTDVDQVIAMAGDKMIDIKFEKFPRALSQAAVAICST